MSEHTGFHAYKDGERFNPECPACLAEVTQTRQAKLRKGIATILESAGASKEWTLNILEYLQSQGVVIMDNRDPADCESCPVAVVCGYVAVIPLIESDSKGIDGKPYIVGASGEGSAVTPLIKDD